MSIAEVEQRRAILDRLPQDQRGAFVTLFLAPVRHGERAPARIVAAVQEDLRRRCRRAIDDADNHVRATAARALALAGWAGWYECLLRAEREHHKAARADQHRHAWLDRQPAPAKQLAYIRALGYGRAIRSKAHASGGIVALKARRVA